MTKIKYSKRKRQDLALFTHKQADMDWYLIMMVFIVILTLMIIAGILIWYDHWTHANIF